MWCQMSKIINLLIILYCETKKNMYTLLLLFILVVKITTTLDFLILYFNHFRGFKLLWCRWNFKKKMSFFLQNTPIIINKLSVFNVKYGVNPFTIK